MIGQLARAWTAGYVLGVKRQRPWPIVEPWRTFMAGYRRGLLRPAKLEQMEFEGDGFSAVQERETHSAAVARDAGNEPG
jgi:hypothetical protein